MPRGGGGGGVTGCRCGGLHGLAGGPSGLARPVAGGGGGVACARLSRFFQYCSLSGVGRPSRPCCWYESATPPLASRLRCCLRADHHEGDSAMMGRHRHGTTRNLSKRMRSRFVGARGRGNESNRNRVLVCFRLPHPFSRVSPALPQSTFSPSAVHPEKCLLQRFICRFLR